MIERGTLDAIADGGLGGVAGTVVMSLLMLGARRVGLVSDLPPERITASALDAVGLHKRPKRVQNVLAVLLHLGFGTTVGALFGLLCRLMRLPIPPAAQGAVYGGLVWLASYAGWVPALDIMPPPPRDERPRPVVMVIAHGVYGGVLGAVVGYRSTARR